MAMFLRSLKISEISSLVMQLSAYFIADSATWVILFYVSCNAMICNCLHRRIASFVQIVFETEELS
jgi:hypothetical protein